MANADMEPDNPLLASAKSGTNGGNANTNREDERAAKRFPCNGRAKVLTSAGQTVDGRMFDISLLGASVMLECHLTRERRCTITVSVFKAGKLHHFQVQATLMHSSLAGQRGFKHGFEFDKPDSNAAKALVGLTGGGPSVFG